MSSSKLSIGTLRGGGVVVGYRCSSRCRHCLYGSGAHRRDGELGGRSLDEVLDLLEKVGPRARYHIGGGEPFLQLTLLEELVAGMTARGLALDYIETNAVWAENEERVARILTRLAAAGLRSLLVSLSPFHAEFVPLERTRRLVAAADSILPGGAFVWIPEFAAELTQQPPDRPLDLTELLERRGDVYAVDLCLRYGLVSGGRAGRLMHRHGVRRHWQEIVGDASCCGARLADTSHFHIDLQGAYVPGLCAGIVLPAEDLPGAIDLAAYPLLAALVDGGVGALVQTARDAGFKPNTTYSASCDLCGHARRFLWDAAAPGQYRELGPSGFYDTRSIDWDEQP